MNEARSPGSMIDCEAAAALMEPLTDLVVRAGAAILAVNRVGDEDRRQVDGSPVTEADLAADRIIGEGLARLAPDIPALSEERVHLAKPPYRGSFFLIDPLDGTKEFVAGRNEFTVNLALVTNGTPLLGIIGAPALGLIWRGIVGRGAERLAVDGAVAGSGRADPDPPASSAWRALDRGRQPLAWRRQDGSLYLRQGPARFARCWDRRSSSAGWRKAAPISIPAFPPPANGTSRRDTPSSARPAARSPMPRARRLQFGSGREGFIVPEFIAWGDPAAV